jgi:hypothetical protein
MLNWIWLALVVLAVAIGGWNNRLGEVTSGAFDGAKTAVTIALGLIGIMALRIARVLHPIQPPPGSPIPATMITSSPSSRTDGAAFFRFSSSFFFSGCSFASFFLAGSIFPPILTRPAKTLSFAA